MINEISGANLAYIGDAVIELLIRERLVMDGGKVGELNKAADGYVRAGYQSEVADRLLPLLSEAETAAYRRGKNVRTNSLPKNATHIEYRKATGLEALFGYLYLSGENERLRFLLEKGFFGITDGGSRGDTE